MPFIGIGVGIPRGGAILAPSPLTIMGSALVGWWTADRDDLITQAATLVSSWKDVIGGYDLVQATGGFKPIYSATSFNGRPGVTFDGADDFVRLGSTPASFPIGSATAEVWVCASQDALAADTTNRNSLNYGATGSGSRAARRTVSTAVNRAQALGSGTTATNVSADYSGRQYMRAHFVNGDIGADVNGTVGATGAAVLATTAANVTLGGSNASSPSLFWQGAIHQALVLNAQPDAAQLTALNAYFAARI